jgi:hypothetical protein
MLGYAADFVDVQWFPAGSYLVEQGESGHHHVLPAVRRGGDPA